jgi:FkbM family methyltransferase
MIPIIDRDSFPRLTCTPEIAQKQASRMNDRFREWWSHSACPDQVWMKDIHQIFETAVGGGDSNNHDPYLILDIGCNKGYTSADFFDALSPGTNMNPHTLVEAIRAVAKDMNTKFDKDGGVCNDSKKPLNEDRTTKRRVQIHCFEPSPATYNMLKSVRSKLKISKGSSYGDGVEWHIHNLGLHDHDGDMSWHSACAKSVGDELCTIVPEDTEGAIRVPVVTVDKFLRKDDGTLPLVHMLKIDAEGLDPAVLAGSTSLLSQSNAMMVMFEFNPGLSEKEDDPHGMWGKGGNPPKKLLEVTTWLDELEYDCYIDTRLVDEGERRKGVPNDAPALYRITGDCLVDEPKVRGWANVVCASRKFGNVASMLRDLATIV